MHLSCLLFAGLTLARAKLPGTPALRAQCLPSRWGVGARLQVLQGASGPAADRDSLRACARYADGAARTPSVPPCRRPDGQAAALGAPGVAAACASASRHPPFPLPPPINTAPCRRTPLPPSSLQARQRPLMPARAPHAALAAAALLCALAVLPTALSQPAAAPAVQPSDAAAPALAAASAPAPEPAGSLLAADGSLALFPGQSTVRVGLVPGGDCE